MRLVYASYKTILSRLLLGRLQGNSRGDNTRAVCDSDNFSFCGRGSLASKFSFVSPRLLPQNWCGQSFFNRPSRVNSITERSARQVISLCPLSDHKGFVIESDPMISSGIGHLLLSSSPFTICRLVAAVGIDALNRICRVGDAHISKKVLKTFKPSITNFNTSPTVIREKSIIRVITSLFYTKPSIVNFGTTHSVSRVGFVQFMRSFGSFFVSDTPARSSAAGFKVVASNFLFIPAIALANKIWNAAHDFLNKNKFAKSIADICRDIFFHNMDLTRTTTHVKGNIRRDYAV